MNDMEGESPLAGIRVLDLTRVLAGPHCTVVLADLGAEVVKVEIPTKGDDARHLGPCVGSESAYFLSLSRSKRAHHKEVPLQQPSSWGEVQ